MLYYTSGGYVYVNNVTDLPKSHHIFCILNQRRDMYITSPFKIMEETFVSFPKIFVKKYLSHELIPISNN